jgi:hypothetical protein
MHTVIWLEDVKGREHSGDVGVDAKWILRKEGGKCGPDKLDSEQRPVAGPCEHGNEPLGSTKYREFLDQLIKKDSAARS